MSGSKPSHVRPAAAGPTILAADDNGVTRRIITARLGRDGYHVVTYGDGADLLAHAAQNKPSLIILDLMMPIKDGYSTLRALKADAELSPVPVLMLSAKNHEDDIVRCLKAGAADYMVKPFSPQELAARAHKLIPSATPHPDH